MRWLQKPPPRFDHGVSLLDVTPLQQIWLDKEIKGALGTGAWGRATQRQHASRAFLVNKPDSPRIFVKFMKVMMEALRSPSAAEDRQELLKLKNRRVATPRHELIEHLGLEVDLKEGLFRVTEMRIDKIHAQAKSIICDATREKRWLSVRRLAAFNGLCESVYLAMPAARLYLRELYFVLSTKRSWGAKVKLTRQSFHDLEWWLRLPVMSWWSGRKIWRSPTRAKLHTDSSLHARGGVLNLNKEARGFCPGELRHLHITQLELEVVFKTVKSFMRELEGKMVWLYCNNQAVVAMLSHFTSRNPELMRRMRKLWPLLDLHDIELQVRYIRSEANEWADRLSRCEDIDDWRLNRRWFEWADSHWGPHTVDRFASEILAQLPRYFAEWFDPHCEGVDSLAYDWRGENNWVNPPWGLLDEEGPLPIEQTGRLPAARDVQVGRDHVPQTVSNDDVEEPQQSTSTTAATVPAGTRLKIYWELDDAWYPGVVRLYDDDGFAEIVYDDGDEEVVDLAEETFSVIHDNEIKKPSFLEKAFGLRWRTELGVSEHSELAEQREWLPATTPTVLLYLASLLDRGKIRATSLQPYLSAINCYHEDLGYDAPAKGRSVVRAVKGMAVLQAQREVASGDILTERTYLPAPHVWAAQQAASASTPRTSEELQLLRAYVYTVFAYIAFGRPDTGVAMHWEHVSSTEEELSIVLLKEKGRRHHRVKRRLQIPWRGVGGLRGVLQNWQVHRDLAWRSYTSSRTPSSNVHGSYWGLPGERGTFEGDSLANEWIQLALDSLGCLPPEGRHFTAYSTRKGAATGARAEGLLFRRLGSDLPCCTSVHRPNGHPRRVHAALLRVDGTAE
ncbi:hypothetical protein CYMTET_41678 [Cymbomonas tetramitiformis]|uniref:RNase H type-1 domain-containing protein n=1 Tax=Cymbomonas tetramitiformis TaxID=36881 RepID=A0AAE0F2E1_9CHLO|nr:hypothetical protein CYMTET_41678 [Cymbomonas tetramitiformis]